MASNAQHVKPLGLLLAILPICGTALPQTRDGSIVGRVQSVNGTPVTNVRVAAFQLSDAKGLSPVDPIAIATTDTEGRYRLSAVPPGRYAIVLNVDRIHSESEREVDAAPAVTLRSEGEVTQDFALSAPRGVTLSGRVHQELMDRNARGISLSSFDRYERATVGLDGVFSFSNVSPGDYRLNLPASQFAWTSKNIHVEGQDITDVEVIPDDSIPVLARIFTEDGTPVPRVSFSLIGPKGIATIGYISTKDSVRSSGMVSEEGWADRPADVLFHAALPVGEYRIAVTRLPAGYRVKSFTYGTTDLLKEPLNLTGKIRQLTITLTSSTRTVTVRGRVIRDATLPPQLTTNRVALSSSALLAPLEAPIRPDGTFEIPRVPPGNYWIAAPNLGWRLTVGNNSIRGLEFRTSRILALYEEAVRRASMPPPPRSASNTEAVLDFTDKPEREDRSDVREPNIDGFEVPVKRASKTVKVRVLVDQGYAIPYLALTIRPNVDAGPPYVEPYTLWSTQGKHEGGLIMGSDGRFTIELSEGRHRVRVDAAPDSYRVKSVTYGSLNLTKDLLQIDKGNPNEIVITIAALPDAPWRTVKGRVTGLANFPQARVVLASAWSKVPLFEATPKADGSFEFPKLPPGSYELLTTPRIAGVPPQSIDIKEGEVPPVSLAIPAQRKLSVRIRSEDGSLQPSSSLPLNLNLTLSKTEGYRLMLSVPLVLQSASEMVCVIDACSFPREKMLGAPVLHRDVANGTTTLTLAEGDYRIEVSRVPQDRILRSLTSGSVDLRDQLLRVGPTTQEITITLSK